MLIFDRFPDGAGAGGFAGHVVDTFGLSAGVYVSQAESDAVDPFPFELTAPIVLVDLPDEIDQRAAIEHAVLAFGGAFAGT